MIYEIATAVKAVPGGTRPRSASGATDTAATSGRGRRPLLRRVIPSALALPTQAAVAIASSGSGMTSSRGAHATAIDTALKYMIYLSPMRAEVLLDRLHDAYNAHDASAAAALYLQDGQHAEAAHGSVRVGRAAVAEGLRGLFGFLPDVGWERQWMVAGGDRAVAGYRLTASVPGVDPARTLQLDGIHVVTAASDAIARSEDYWDREALRAQLPKPATEFAHTCYRTADLTRAVDFYRRLGFAERRRFETDSGELHVFLGLGAEELELVAGPAGGGQRPAHLHVGVRVRGLDERLAALGRDGIVPVAPPAASRPGAPRVCLMQDPDGNAIELIETVE